jgi:hypothetical protein
MGAQVGCGDEKGRARTKASRMLWRRGEEVGKTAGKEEAGWRNGLKDVERWWEDGTKLQHAVSSVKRRGGAA